MPALGQNLRQGKTQDSPPGVTPRRRLAVAAALLSLTLLAYGNSFFAEWVGDSRAIIQHGPLMRATTWRDGQQSGVQRIFTEDYWWPWLSSGLYRPVTVLSYWLNWRWSVWGQAAGAVGPGSAPAPEEASVVGFHVVNVLLHWANAYLVYLLAMRLAGKFWVAAFSAALFAAHPIATEAVTHLVGRADLLAALGVLGGLLMYIRSTDHVMPQKVYWLAGSVLMTTIGVFSKENAVVVAAMIVCYDLIVRWLPSAAGQRARPITQSFASYAALAAPVAMLFVVRRLVFAAAEKPPVVAGFPENPISEMDVVPGRITALRVAAEQFWRLFWPQHLSYDYSYHQIPLFEGDLSGWVDQQSLLLVGALLLAILIVVLCFWRNQAAMFCLAFCAISYLPTSNLWISIGSIAAERFMYLPLAAMAMLVCIAVDAAGRRFAAPLDRPSPGALANHRGRYIPHAVLAALVLAGGVRTFVRNFDWSNEVSIASTGIEAAPRSYKPYTALAEEIFWQNPRTNGDQAIELGVKSMQIVDDLPAERSTVFPYIRLGGYYLSKAILLSRVNADGSLTVSPAAGPYFRKSAATLERAIPIDRALSELNRRREIRRGKLANRVPDTGAAELYVTLGEAYQRLGMGDQAVDALRYARHLTPAESDRWFKIASLLLELRRFDEACVSLLQYLAIEPVDNRTWLMLQRGYDQIDTKGTPAVQIQHGVPKLNLEHPLVQEHFRHAWQDLVRVYRQARRSDLADAAQNAAVTQHSLPAKLFEPSAHDSVAPQPPAALFYTPD